VAALVAGGLVLGGVPGSVEPARVAEPRATVVAMPASSPTAAPVAGSAGRPQRTGTERAGGVAAPEPSRVFAGNRAHKAADALSSGDRLSPVSIEDWLRQLRRAVRAWWRPGHWF
jgi:hypothetical protein